MTRSSRRNETGRRDHGLGTRFVIGFYFSLPAPSMINSNHRPRHGSSATICVRVPDERWRHIDSGTCSCVSDRVSDGICFERALVVVDFGVETRRPLRSHFPGNGCANAVVFSFSLYFFFYVSSYFRIGQDRRPNVRTRSRLIHRCLTGERFERRVENSSSSFYDPPEFLSTSPLDIPHPPAGRLRTRNYYYS